jgi:hypothetical protein
MAEGQHGGGDQGVQSEEVKIVFGFTQLGLREESRSPNPPFLIPSEQVFHTPYNAAVNA